MATISIQTVSGPAQGHTPDDIQKIGPGSASPPKKPTGKGSAAGPPTTEAPPIRTQSSLPTQLGEIRSALDLWRSADSKYADAESKLAKARRDALTRARASDQSTGPTLKALENDRDGARDAASKVYTALVETVYKTVIGSCGERCTFASMRRAAEAIDEFVRTDEEQKEDAGRRQLVVRQAIYAVLLDAARASLRRLPAMAAEEKKSTMDAAVSWITKRENPPQYASAYSRLKPLIVYLVNSVRTNPSQKIIATQVAKDLVAACRNQGMVFTPDQRNEIERLLAP